MFIRALLFCLVASTAYSQTFDDIRAVIDGAQNGDSVVFAPGEYRGSEPVNVSKSNCTFDFTGVKMSAIAEVDHVISFNGNRNTVKGLTVNGGLDGFQVSATSKRNIGIRDRGDSNQFANCHSGHCHIGPYAAAWELNGSNTILVDCGAYEGGLWNYRTTNGPIRLVNCASVHLRDRPGMVGTKRRHLGCGASKGRTVSKVEILGGKWYSNFQWCSIVLDAGTGKIANFILSDVSITYGAFTRNSTGNGNFNVIKLDAVEAATISNVFCSHPSVNNAMFVNVASLCDLALNGCDVDGYIGYSHTQNGGGGGTLQIDRCKIGLRSRNKVVIGGYQTNNPKLNSRLSKVNVRNCELKAVGHIGGVFWARSRDNVHSWRLENTNLTIEGGS